MPDLSTWTLTVSSLLLALFLDRMLGEPRRWHPLVGFGWLAGKLEYHLNAGQHPKIFGLIALCIALLPFGVLAQLMQLLVYDSSLLQLLLSAVIVYLAIGWRSLEEHATAVSDALIQSQLPAAREAVSRIVSRDCAQLDETEIAKATTESVLENGADAIFAALFWFIIAGLPGVVIYRLANTLDAMWGYKNTRFIHFGWAAARFDDLLNFIPARLTALSYALMGNTKSALHSWQTQAKRWKSPNAGPVMAAGAGAIHTSLGGPAIYHGQTQQRPVLGVAPDACEPADANSIRKARCLINKSLALWCGILLCSALLQELV